MKKATPARIILCILLFLPILAFSKIVYVSPSGSGTGDGSSWANASNIYNAIGSADWTVAKYGDQVWLKQGTYTIGYSLGLTPRCSVFGGFVGTETAVTQRSTNPALTIINDGVWSLDQWWYLNPYGEGSLNDVTLVNANVYNDYNGRINHCVFDNSFLGGENSQGNTTWIVNTVFKNSTRGAVYMWPGARMAFADCEFYNNYTDGGGGNGGGAINSGGSLFVYRCKFYNNSSGNSGGAIQCGSYTEIYNSLFYNNTAATRGGAIKAYNGAFNGWTQIYNCTITGNSAPNGGSGIEIDNVSNGASEIHNNIIWGNTGSSNVSSCTQCAGQPYELVFRHNIIQGGPPVASFILNVGNIDADPLLTASYQLKSCSPAINAGTNSFTGGDPDFAMNPRIVSGVVDMGCYEFQLPKFAASTTPSGNASFCGGGGTVTASAGSSFLWNTGATTQSINVTQAGNYSVTITNHDGCVAVSPAVNITLSDVNAPIISGCPSNIVVSPTSGCNAVVNWTPPTATDNCAVTSFTSTHAPGATFGPGTTTVTYTAKDAMNNTSTCTFTVRVIDDVAPNHNATSTASVNIPAGSTSGWSPMIRYFQDPLPIGSKITGLSITYTAVDHGYGGTGADAQIYVAGNYIGANQLLHHSQTFTLNYTGSLQGYIYGAANPLQMNFVGYPGWQANWQSGTITFTYTYNNIPGLSITRQLTNGSVTINPADIDPGLTDNCGIKTRTLSKSTYTCSDVGTHPVTLIVTDYDGNTATAIGSVTIVDGSVPVINCPADQTVNNTPGQCTASVNPGTATATGGCLNASPAGVRSDGKALTEPYPIGVTNITWSITSMNGQSTSCVQKITVIDNQAPVFGSVTTVAGSITVNVNSGTWMDVISWTLRDKFNNVVLSGGPYGLGGSHTSGSTSGANGPFTFFIEAQGGPTDNFANWSVRCNGTAIASGCIRGTSGPSCGATGTSTVSNIASCTTTTGTPGCPSSNITLNAIAGGCTAIATWTVPTAMDNCPGVVITSNYNPGASFPVGTTPVVYTATDASGNTTTCSFNVIVIDTQNPTISCPGNVVTTTGSGLCGAVVNYNVTYGDNCTGAVLEQTSGLSSGATFPVGVTTNSFKVTDASGRTATCSFTVTITDNSAPVITGCPSNISVHTDNGLCSAVVNWTAPAASDNCSVTSFTSTHNPGTAFPTGTTTVTYTAKDAAGQTTTCSFTVTVTDNEAPRLPFGTKTVNIPYGGNTSGWSPWYYYFNDPLPSGATVTGISLTYTAVDQGWGGTGAPSDMRVSGTYIGSGQLLHHSQTHTLNYTGTVPGYVYGGTNNLQMNFWGYPGWVAYWQGGTLTIHYGQNGANASITRNLDASGNASIGVSDFMAGAMDNCGVASSSLSKTSFNCSNQGANNVTLTVTDVNGNTSTKSVVVNIADNTAPVVTTASGSLDRTVSCSDVAAFSNALALVPAGSDNCSATRQLLSDVQTAGCGSTFTRTRTWKFTDAAGNSSTPFTQVIQVVDDTKPVILVAASGQAVDCDGNGNSAQLNAWLASQGGAIATDNCSGVNWTNNFSALSDLCGATGSATVTFTATDVCGNSASTTATFTIRDITAPSINTQSTNMTVDCDGSGNSAVLQAWLASNGGASASDACSGLTWTNNFSSLSDLCGTTGAASVTFTVTDACGNRSLTTATFTIRDITAPAISTQAVNQTVQCDGAGNAAELSAWLASNGGASASDVCSDVTWTNNFSSLSDLCGATGSATVTFTATDACGNSSSTTATFTIVDVTAPTITKVATSITVDCDGAGNTAQLNAWLNSQGGASASDVCSGVTWTPDFSLLSDLCGTTGAATVTFTATDACGNSSSTTATFTIRDITAPVITTQSADMTVDCDGNGNTAALNAWLASNGGALASDVCSDLVWAHNFTALSDECGATGSAMVTFTVTDACGNSSSTTATFKIRDITVPVITTPSANLTVECDGNGNAATLQAWLGSHGGASASDVCSGVTWTHNFTALSDGCGETGSATVTFIATDACGNSSSTTATFTIVDVTAPVFTSVPENINVKCAADVPAALASSASASDVCSGVQMAVADVITNQTQLHRYIITRTWTATDACGNNTTASQVITVYDDVAPVFTSVTASVFHCFEDNSEGIYSVPAVSGIDVCDGGVTYSYAISGATNRSGSGNDASGAFNVGNSTVTWTLTDASGNTATATTSVEINPAISVDIPTVTVLPQGALPNTIYYGYAPASALTISAVPSGGTAPYSYSWSTSSASLVFSTPDATHPETITLTSAVGGTYTVTVVITDSKGCTATFTKGITVIDIRCGAAMDKVLVCRTVTSPTPTNPNAPTNPGGGRGNGNGGGNGGGGGAPTPPDNCVTATTVATMLANGATLGACPATPARGIITEPVVKQSSIKAYPNPTSGIFHLQLANYNPGRVQVDIMSANGKVVESRIINVSHINENYTFNLSRHAAGLYVARIVSAEGVESVKISVAR
jgi:hypothetical protein